jgi:hypothetical protein
MGQAVRARTSDLEKAMKATAELVLSALSEASEIGDELEPALLLAAAAQDPDPIAALSSMDRGNELFDAVAAEIGFLYVLRQTGKAATEEERRRLVGVLRWVIRSFREWQLDQDPKSRLLVSLFVVTRICEQAAEQFWEKMPDRAANDGLRERLTKFAAELQMNLSAHGFSHRPISDAEAIQRFAEADKNCEWTELAQQLGLIEPRILPGTFLSQSVGYLRRLFPDSLIRAASGVRQILIAIKLLEPLSMAEMVALALASENPYVEFAAFYLCATGRRNGSPVTPDLVGPLSDLLLKVSLDSERWTQWMLAFARHPIRFPDIAPSIGRTLSRTSDAAVRAYVSSIALTTMGRPGRDIVAETLGVFRATASEDRQVLLWRAAHDRWKDWNFGEKEAARSITAIAHCELDYALVGYAVNCMSEEERQKNILETSINLSTLDLRWFGSVMNFSDEKYLLLSRIQPILHVMTEPSNWLAAVDYWPLEKTDRYAELFLGII